MVITIIQSDLRLDNDDHVIILMMMIVTFSDVNFLISLVAWASRRWKLVVRVRTWAIVIIVVIINCNRIPLADNCDDYCDFCKSS